MELAPHPIQEITIESKDEEVVLAYLSTHKQGYFDIIYDRYSGKIFGRCISILKDETQAEDAVQDIFLKIITNMSKFGGKSRFSTWVYSITYNWCIDIVRKRKKRTNVETPEDIEDHDMADEVSDKFLLEVKIDRLRTVLDEIPEDDKAVLMMKYLEEMSIKEITDVMSKSESAVKMQIKRAKLRFKKKYYQLYNGAV